MKLTVLLNDLGDYTLVGRANKNITMITNDSRNVERGGLFIAVPGFKDDGTRYLDDAIKRGAVAVVLEKKHINSIKPSGDVSYIFVEDARIANLMLARCFYKHPQRDVTLIGVTGTNGKTTVTYILESMLKAAGFESGVIGTINYRYKGKIIKAENTTPDALYIYGLLRKMADNGVTHVVMEVSSHALFLNRVMPADYDYAIFTNLSQDHLDFHSNMEDYFKAKLKLFQGLHNFAYAVINADDGYGRRIPDHTRAAVIDYAIKNEAKIKGSIISLSVDGTEFFMDGERYSTTLVGEHNVYNILASYGVAKSIGIDRGKVRKVVSSLKPIPGRFDRVENSKGYNVFVDYAHTPDALEHLLLAANRVKKARIITVFGCGGDRDRGKRPLMGRVVETMSDIAIVTSDNPRTEDPLKIIEDIKEGMKKDNHLIIPDRREAIFKAIEIAGKDDIVLIAGKGHEDYQILKDRTIHFDDKEVATEAINDIG